MKENPIFVGKKSIKLQGQIMDFSTPKVMGILNMTPDSFYDGGENQGTAFFQRNIERIAAEGADIIDIGGQSSRPGAKQVSPGEEIRRIAPALEHVKKHFPGLPVSVDTFWEQVARTAIEDYEVEMINDISAGNLDDKMLDLVAEKDVPYVMMHMQGTPASMQENPRYTDITSEICVFLHEKISWLNARGVKDLIIDPGFGFGKTLGHNYEILKKLKQFSILEKPILVGLSRKSMIYKALNISPEQALNGTMGAHMIALMNGANILRVHDVKETKEIITIYNLVA